jgi:P27 family predicted phage terminase small subunit
MLKATRDWWAEFWASELAAATLADTDGPAIERLATLYDLRRRALKSIKKQPLVDGSQGQKVLNPLARQMSTWDAEIRQLEDRFGLTPRSRLNLGLQLGAAKKQLDDLARDFTDDGDGGTDGPEVVVDI